MSISFNSYSKALSALLPFYCTIVYQLCLRRLRHIHDEIPHILCTFVFIRKVFLIGNFR
ncbi:hypothetical protein HOLDEFILI_03392 [Holdemania filiformis DSM 12042]|uniref:Uncharacterized protein n=1 Tax=Holdemania filiformis DSM 12042 TaxID=545696 RepID=B9YC38_9FIRM|nr:hypothetical protein HOLDEFILI_03392 [Holdemania filiformis DSM 12042]